MLDNKEKALKIINILINSVNIQPDKRIYVDILCYRIQNGKKLSDSLIGEIKKIDTIYKNQFEENLLLQHYKSFENICKKLDKLVTAN